MLGNLLIDFSKKTSFWNIPKWNIGQTNWDRESNQSITLEQISDYSRLSFTFWDLLSLLLGLQNLELFKSSP